MTMGFKTFMLAVTIGSCVLADAPSAWAQEASASSATREPKSRITRNLALVGLGGGFIIALASDLCGTSRPYGSGQEPACLTPKPLLYMGAGAALGALIGHQIDKKRRRVLYGPSMRSIGISPVVVRNGAGAVVVVIW